MDGNGERGEAAAVRLIILGGFRVEQEGQPVSDAAWARPQAKTLVKLLAAEQSHRLHREQIIELLWPEVDPDAGAANLRKLVHFARRAIEPPGASGLAMEVTRDAIALGSAVAVDADDFEAAAWHALEIGGAAELERARALYSGELLPDDRYAPWAEGRRDELARVHHQVLEGLARTLEGEDPDRAVSRYQELIALDATDEAAHRALMRLFLAQGSSRRALAQYRQCVAALEEQLGARPSEATERLYQTIRDGRTLPAGRAASGSLPADVVQAPRTPLVGRERVLSVLLGDPGLHGMRGGEPGEHPPVTLIGGDAGVGKTRLAAEVARAAARRAVVLWGSCSQFEGGIAYGPFVNALEGYIAGMSADERDRVGKVAPELGHILPSISAKAPLSGDPRSEQARLFAGVVRALEQLAGSHPLLLVVDDLQQADESSLALLRYLADAARRRPWLLVATYREEALAQSSRLRTLLAELSRLRLSRQVDLLPLGRRECAALVDALLGGGSVPENIQERLFQLSLGNPLFVTELVHALKESGQLGVAEGSWTLQAAGALTAPPRITDLIAQQLDSLDDATRRLLAIAAVAGASFRPDVALDAARLAYPGQTEDDSLRATELAVEARVLEERGDQLAFRHPLFTETVYRRLSEARRRHLHGALARALEERYPAELESLAQHYARSDFREKAIAYLERAGDRTRAVYANAVAEGYYRDLIERLEEVDRPGDLARARYRLGRVLAVTSRYEEAVSSFAQAMALYRQVGDLAGAAETAATAGMAHANRGTIEDGLSLVAATLQEVGAAAPPLTQARLHIALAWLLTISGAYERALESSREAERAARAAKGPEAKRELTQALSRRGGILVVMGELAAAREANSQAVELAERTGELHTLGNSLTNLAYDFELLGDFRQARACLERARGAFEQVGDEVWTAISLAGMGRVDFFLGDWQTAARLLDGAIAQLRALGAPAYTTGYALVYRAVLGVAEGNLEHAATLAGEAAAMVPTLKGAHWLLAWVDLLRGQAAQALTRLEPLLPPGWEGDGAYAAMQRTGFESAIHLGYAGWAYQETGDSRRAERASAVAVQLNRRAGSSIRLLDALCPRAIVLLGQRRYPEAGAAIQEALELARRTDFGWGEACLLTLQARLAAALGDDDRESALRGEVEAILTRIGATREALRGLEPERTAGSQH